MPPAELAQAAAARLLWVAPGDDDRPAGFALARPMDNDLYLAEMSVALGLQGRGLGRELLRAVVAHARGAGIFHGVVLTTDRELPWNAPFYRRQGFAEVPVAQQTPALRAGSRPRPLPGSTPRGVVPCAWSWRTEARRRRLCHIDSMATKSAHRQRVEGASG